MAVRYSEMKYNILLHNSNQRFEFDFKYIFNTFELLSVCNCCLIVTINKLQFSTLYIIPNNNLNIQ